MRASNNGLPDYLQRELTFPGFRHRWVRQIPTAARQPGLGEYLGTVSALKGVGRLKVWVIQDVEKLRPELHFEGLRNLRHREVLVCREVKIEESRTDNTIAAGIAQEIRATARNPGKRHAPRCDRRIRRRHGHPVGTGVDVSQARRALPIMVDGIASRNAIRNAEDVGAVILYPHRIPIDEWSRGNSAIQLDDAG